MMLRTARLTDDSDYDAGETAENVPRTRSYFGYDDAYNGSGQEIMKDVLLQSHPQEFASQNENSTSDPHISISRLPESTPVGEGSIAKQLLTQAVWNPGLSQRMGRQIASMPVVTLVNLPTWASNIRGLTGPASKQTIECRLNPPPSTSTE
ncbi:unnamed protein product, partial [Protopolystoma xenopodis]